MQHSTIAQQLQTWQAFFAEELWSMQPLSACLDDILSGLAPVSSDKVNPGLHPGDLDELIEAAGTSGDVHLIDSANLCAALGNMYMEALDMADSNNARSPTETLH